jgi:hypothetical protein
VKVYKCMYNSACARAHRHKVHTLYVRMHAYKHLQVHAYIHYTFIVKVYKCMYNSACARAHRHKVHTLYVRMHAYKHLQVHAYIHYTFIVKVYKCMYNSACARAHRHKVHTLYVRMHAYKHLQVHAYIHYTCTSISSSAFQHLGKSVTCLNQYPKCTHSPYMACSTSQRSMQYYAITFVITSSR